MTESLTLTSLVHLSSAVGEVIRMGDGIRTCFILRFLGSNPPYDLLASSINGCNGDRITDAYLEKCPSNSPEFLMCTICFAKSSVRYLLQLVDKLEYISVRVPTETFTKADGVASESETVSGHLETHFDGF